MNLLIQTALMYVGLPYHYGGNNPMTGFDCSGFVCEVMRQASVITWKEDLTAQQLFDRLSARSQMQAEKPGALAFYGPSPAQVNHVALHIDRYRVIEVGGGDKTTVTLEEATRRGACVRVRPARYRKDYLGSLMPDYAGIGLL